ncbi:MAG: outer membrane protein assembly factor BamD [Candidatus Zixiibacteriota bacterium]
MKRTLAHAIMLTLLTIFVSNFVGCGGRPSLANLTARELFDKGKAKYSEKDYFDAIEYFQAIVYNYPGESMVDTAQYYLALSYFGNHEYELAQVEFNRLLVNYPSSVYFEHSIFMKAVCFFEGTPRHYGLDQSDLETAIKQFDDFIIDYPEAELVPEAQRYLLLARTRLAKKYYNSGVVYNRLGAYESAGIYFQKVVDDFTDTEFAPQATYKIAEMEYKRRMYSESSKKFANFAAVFPEHEWAAEALEKAPEAAYKSGEESYKAGEFAQAKERLESFLETYPDHEKVDDARKLLEQLKAMPSAEIKKDDDNS